MRRKTQVKMPWWARPAETVWVRSSSSGLRSAISRGGVSEFRFSLQERGRRQQLRLERLLANHGEEIGDGAKLVGAHLAKCPLVKCVILLRWEHSGSEEILAQQVG